MPRILPLPRLAPLYRFSMGYFRGAESTITNLANEAAVSAAVRLEDRIYGLQRAYLETYR
jgi:hypothetical protein